MTTDHTVSERQATRQLDAEIAKLREDLALLVAELDRRRHDLLDVRTQVRRHARPVILTGVTLLGAASALVWLAVTRNRQQQSARARAGRLRDAVARMIDRPERVAAAPTVPARIFTAVATAALTTTAKRILDRGIQGLLDGRPRPVRGGRRDEFHHTPR
jgi:hypothetical protein